MTVVTGVVLLGGRPVVRKTGTADAARAVRHEAAVLAAARHPGVVTLVGHGDEGGSAWLATEMAGSCTLAGPPRPTSPLACLAAVASTLADLHERGIVHGRVSADHVVVGRDGTARLCGFGDGGDPAVDVVAVARLAEELAADAPDSERSLLLAAAARVLHSDDGPRPPMRAVADLLSSGPPLPLAARPGTPAGPGGGRRYRRRLLACALALLTVAAGGVAATAVGRDRGTSPSASAREGGPTAAAPPDAPVPAGPVAEDRRHRPDASSPPVTRAWPPCPPGGPDLDGNGCGDPVQLDGGVATSGGHSWSVARDGEVALLGDWDCDGVLTVAVVRLSTGSVWVHETWPLADGPAEARPVATVGRASAAASAEGAGDDGCAAIEVTLPSGEIVTVDP